MAFETTTQTTEATASDSPFSTVEDLNTDVERIGACGLPSSGKSHFLLSVFTAIQEKYQLPPEKVTVFIIDADNGGMTKLIRRGLIPEQYKSCVRYSGKPGWESAINAVQNAVEQVPDLVEKNGPGSTWILVDNIYKTYRWGRDQYCQDVFGMTELDRAKAQRRKALANPDNKRGVLPTFDQQIDYGTITPMYLTNFWDPIMSSGANILVTFPTYERWEDKKDGSRAPTSIDYKCQAQVVHDLDDIVWFRTPVGQPNQHLASMQKSRTLPDTKLFKSVADMDMSKLLTIFEGA